MKIDHVAATFKVTFREFYRGKAAVYFTVAFPVLLMLLFGFIFQGQGDVTYELPVQNLDGGPHSTALMTAMGETGIFNVINITEDVDPNQYLLDNDANTILVIPEGYSDNVTTILISRAMGLPATETENLTVYYDPSNTAAMTKVQILNSMVAAMNKGYANATDTISMELESTVSEDFDYIDFFVPGILAMSVMTSTLFGTVMMNNELRQNGIFRKLATTPITQSEWTMSNLLFRFLMSLISSTAILAVAAIVFGLRPYINIYMFLFIALNVFAFSGIGMIISRFVKEAESAQAASNLIMFPMMFLSGTFFPFESMPEFLQSVAKFLPLYYINEGMRASMISLNMDIIGYSLVVMTIFAGIVFVLGAALTSWKEK